jgi:hypothetical protein
LQDRTEYAIGSDNQVVREKTMARLKNRKVKVKEITRIKCAASN